MGNVLQANGSFTALSLLVEQGEDSLFYQQ